MNDILDGEQSVVLAGDCRTTMRGMPEKCVQVCFTSPPYFGLRDYQAPASVWGGDDPECRHDWQDASWVNTRGNDDTASAKQRTSPGSVGHRNQVREQQVCALCGAWYGCLGAEPTPQLFVAHLVEVMREVWRVLRDDGVAFLNIADSYSSQGGPQVVQTRNHNREGGSDTQNGGASRSAPSGIRPKSLCLVPERLAIALSDDGWIIRNRNSWMKGCSFLPEWSGSVMPSSAGDRFVASEEPVWFLAKSNTTQFWSHRSRQATRTKPEQEWVWRDDVRGIERPVRDRKRRNAKKSPWRLIPLWTGSDYYFDQVAVREGAVRGNAGSRFDTGKTGEHQQGRASTQEREDTGSRNPRNVWAIPTEPLGEGHFAAFPERLPEIGILAASAEKSCALCGAPWQRIVERAVKPHPDRYSKLPDASQFSVAEGNYAEGGSLGALVEKTTVGFQPTCTCDADTLGSIVLDPFAGSGTTGRVALRLNRRFIGCEINEEYAAMARHGIDKWHVKRPRTKPSPPKGFAGDLFTTTEPEPEA